MEEDESTILTMGNVMENIVITVRMEHQKRKVNMKMEIGKDIKICDHDKIN